MPLTDTVIRNAKPKDKPYKLTGGGGEGGLLLLVQPSGAKWWRLKYRIDGKEKSLSLGVYPDVSLKDARVARDEAKALIASGVDPSFVRKVEAAAGDGNTFKDVALAWHAQWKEGRSARHAHDVMRRLEADVFPVIGHVSVKTLTAPMLIAMAKRIESRGALDIAKRALQMCGQIMRYAVAHGLAERNPAADVKPSDALAQRKKKNYARLEAKELPELLRKINDYDGTTVTRCALRLMALTFVRTTELIGARWDEIDREANLWRIPAERMKMKTPHLVPLSRQALAVLEELRGVTGNREHLFAGERNPRKQISNNTILYALYRMGYHSRMTGHGFRGVASTILHEKGFPHEHIEIQLAHQERNQVSAAYNHATYVKQRAEMMQWWADYLTRAAILRPVLPMKMNFPLFSDSGSFLQGSGTQRPKKRNDLRLVLHAGGCLYAGHQIDHLRPAGDFRCVFRGDAAGQNDRAAHGALELFMDRQVGCPAVSGIIRRARIEKHRVNTRRAEIRRCFFQIGRIRKNGLDDFDALFSQRADEVRRVFERFVAMQLDGVRFRFRSNTQHMIRRPAGDDAGFRRLGDGCDQFLCFRRAQVPRHRARILDDESHHIRAVPDAHLHILRTHESADFYDGTQGATSLLTRSA